MKSMKFGDAQDVILAGIDVVLVVLDFLLDVILGGADELVVLCMAVVSCVDTNEVELSNSDVLEESDVWDDESTVDEVLHDDVEVELSVEDVVEPPLLFELKG